MTESTFGEGAVRLIQETAIDADNKRIPTWAADAVRALPKDYQLVDLEKYGKAPRRFRGEFVTNDVGDFISYANQQRDGRVFCDTTNALQIGPQHGALVLLAVAIFDFGTVEYPQFREHRAKLALRPTPEFARFIAGMNKRMDQQEAIHFVEDLAGTVSGFTQLGAEISARTYDFASLIASMRNVKIRASSERDHAVGDFKQSRSSLDEVEATVRGGMEPPAGISFNGVPFLGLPELDAHARMSIVTSRDDDPAFMFRLVMPGTLERNIGENFKKVLRDDLTLPVLVGEFR